MTSELYVSGPYNEFNEFLRNVDFMPIFAFLCMFSLMVTAAFFYYSYYAVVFSLRYCLKSFCLDIHLEPCSCCWNLLGTALRSACPSKVKIVFKKCFVNKITNFLKNRSRPFIDTDYGLLDRELKDDEDLLNSEKRKVSASVYMSVLTIALLLSLRSFLVRVHMVNRNYPLCFDVNKTICFNYSFIYYEYSIPYNVDGALMTFGSVTVAYYFSLKALSLIFQYCYRFARVIRHFLLLLGMAAGIVYLSFRMNYYFSLYFFGRTLVTNESTILPSLLIFFGFLSALIIPWEKVYTIQYMKGPNKGRHSSKEGRSSMEELAASGDSVCSEETADSSSCVTVTVIDMEEEEGFRSNISYNAL